MDPAARDGIQQHRDGCSSTGMDPAAQGWIQQCRDGSSSKRMGPAAKGWIQQHRDGSSSHRGAKEGAKRITRLFSSGSWRRRMEKTRFCRRAGQTRRIQGIKYCCCLGPGCHTRRLPRLQHPHTSAAESRWQHFGMVCPDHWRISAAFLREAFVPLSLFCAKP